ncbi:hypothetical protein ACFX1R_006836 [Malus domestica]
MNVPAVCAINQATLALYAARRTSGIVVNIGFQVTSVVPILNGKVMRKVGVEVMGLGALKLTGFLRELLQQNNINFTNLLRLQSLSSFSVNIIFFFPGRLEKELHGLLPPSVSNGITVVPPPYGADTAWFGAKIISNVSSVTICIEVL